MSDPFERAKAIRKGELDDEMPRYEELTGWLQRVPVTWLPGLLSRTAEMCVLKKVFADDKAMLAAIIRAQDQAHEHPGGVLR